MEAASENVKPRKAIDGNKENEIEPATAESQLDHDSCNGDDTFDGSEESDYSDFSESTDTEPEWDSESESGDEEMTSPAALVSAAAAADWSDVPCTATVCAFKVKPGLVDSAAKSPVDFFKLMFQKSLFENLVTNINRNGRRMLNEKLIKQWNDVTTKEFRVFLGLILNIGTINTTVFADFWKKDRGIHDPIKYMTETRFSMILKFLDFGELSEKKDRMSKVSLIVNYFNDVMKKVVAPEKILCMGESIVPFHESLYLLTDQHGLVHKLLVYKGWDDDELEEMTKREREQLLHARASEVVRRLLEDRLGLGHSVYIDDRTSVELAKFLVAQNTHVTGILKRKQEGNPPEIIERELKVGDKISKYIPEGIGVMIWKKNVDYHVVMISSEHGTEWREDGKKNRPSSKKPACVLEFKKYGDGVKKHDEMMTEYYSTPDISAWHKRVGVHILQILLLNAFHLYKQREQPPTLTRLLKFRKVVIDHLLTGSDSD